MKIKTQDLISAALDWAVAKAQGDMPVFRPHVNSKGATIYRSLDLQHAGIDFRPSTNWAQGGLIVERMLEAGLLLQARPETLRWAASVDSPNRFVHGPTALIAAMRCYVTSKLGDEVEVPEVLALCGE